MIKLILAGACGKMGQAILHLLPSNKSIRLAHAVEAPGNIQVGKYIYDEVELVSDLSKVVKDCDVVIDFTGAESSLGNAKIAAAAKKPMVIGATGHDKDQKEHIITLARDIPIVLSPNMSVGVSAMFKIIEDASRIMGSGYKIDIVETHHVHKKDAPSGTAKKMVEAVKGVMGDRKEVEVRSIREGEVIGDHTITFASPYETLAISHHAVSREVFATGALKAAEWIVGQPAGLYGMNDVLGIR